MARLVVTEFVSLDGVMEAPGPAHDVDFAGWTMPYWNDEVARFKNEELFAADALLLGRTTYDGFAAAWPSRTGDDYSDRINAMPKHVVTSRPEGLPWQNSHPVGGDLAAEVRRLIEPEGGDLLVFGSASVVRQLVRADLVDEYRLAVYPVVIGRGLTLFGDGAGTGLRLADATTTLTGVLLLRYERAATR